MKLSLSTVRDWFTSWWPQRWVLAGLRPCWSDWRYRRRKFTSIAFISKPKHTSIEGHLRTCFMCKHYCQEESHPRNWKRHANYCRGNSFAGIPDGSFNLQVWCHCSRLRLPDTHTALLLRLGLVLSVCLHFPRKIARMPPFIQDSVVYVLPFQCDCGAMTMMTHVLLLMADDSF